MFIYFVNKCLDDKMSLEEAVAEAVKRAKSEGIAQGEASGRAAEKIEMARTMKADNEPLEKIAKYTGLSIEDIDRL